VKLNRIVGISGIVVAVLIGLFLVVGAVLPKRYDVSRTRTIDAPPDAVWAHLVDLHAHEAWSPWKARDPSMVFTYGESAAGEGAVYTWTSDNSGAGTYTIVEAEAPRRMTTRIQFEGMGASDGYWRLEPAGEGTAVTWGFAGENGGIMGGYFTLMMDSAVGADFEDGLARLDAAVTADAK